VNFVVNFVANFVANFVGTFVELTHFLDKVFDDVFDKGEDRRDACPTFMKQSMLFMRQDQSILDACYDSRRRERECPPDSRRSDSIIRARAVCPNLQAA
jgi:hypothetical protein